jgi:hypothetical protein
MFRPTTDSLKALGLGLLLGGGLLLATGCEGSSSGSSSPAGDTARAMIQNLEYGRLVNIYAWRRVDPKVADRLDPRNRQPVLVSREVLVNPGIFNEDRFASDTARYLYMPYDRQTGHRDLLILWDDQEASEKGNFQKAMDSASSGLPLVSDHSAFGFGSSQPPLVPADAAVRITFDRPLGLETEFFKSAPSSIQVLELLGDPTVVGAGAAYSRISTRVISKEAGRHLIIDPEVSGFEADGLVPNPFGFPPSQTKLTANIRIAIPTEGLLADRIKVSPDNLPELNAVDVNGDKAVIRDFRAGNSGDDFNGNLFDVDKPEIVARKEMGILSIDVASRTVTINKRYADLVLRGRLPFVDGALSSLDGKPLGPRDVPQGRALQYGDVIAQEVLSPATGELVRIKAEILENLDIPIEEKDPFLGKGGIYPTSRLLLSTVTGHDSRGNAVTMVANALEPLGATCEAVVHYHDQMVLITDSTDVGDKNRRSEFLRFTPAPPRLDANRNPLPPNKDIIPGVQVSVEFSKPMALNGVKTDENLILANRTGDDFAIIRDNPKVGVVAVEPTIPTDLRGDGMAVNMNPPLGLFHRNGQDEPYYVHVQAGQGGPTDRSGNRIELFDDTTSLDSVTFDFNLDPGAQDNLVGAIVRRFSSPDEDGSREQDLLLDYFGQFTVQPALGRILGYPTVRFSRLADSTTLPSIIRGNQGECPAGTVDTLYHGPVMITNPLDGGIREPHLPQGSRVQHTYREDDFQLGHRSAGDFELDVEQLYWAPWIARSPSLLTYDVLDRYTMTLSTAEKRPDIRVFTKAGTGNPPPPPTCGRDAAWMARNGLSTNFEGNYLDGASRARVISNKVYVINPSKQFAAKDGVVFLAYRDFEQSYTWRDRRLVGWDAKNQQVTGLGGSADPNNTTSGDRTTDITSPWLPELDDKDEPIQNNTTQDFTSGYSNLQADDFKGTIKEDHHPIALPLLIDMQVWPDDTQNGIARGENQFMLAGFNAPQPSLEAGFYNAGIPWARVQSSGGISDKNVEILVDPGNAKTANGGWLQNNIFGRFMAPPGDGMIYWAQADFVRKLSVVTSGYVDLMQPNKHEWTPPSGWSGSSFGKAGYPNFQTIAGGLLRPTDLTVVTAPTFLEQRAGTSISVEFRGSESFDKSDTIYQPITKETAAKRGNLLSPDYAEEQYRYTSSKRVNATGVTAYTKKITDLVSSKTKVSPRFLNWRFTFFNNTKVEPATVPHLDFFAVKYRMRLPD